MSEELTIERARAELEELNKKPLKFSKPQLYMHPFLDVVFRPGMQDFPVINPNPDYQSIIKAMRWTDYAYMGVASAGLAWMTLIGERPIRNTALSLGIAVPIFFGISMANCWSRLVGLKSIDDV
jgi:hypothetical protein